jgi:ATP-dependent helicase HrpB
VLDRWQALRDFARDPRVRRLGVHVPAAQRAVAAARQIERIVRPLELGEGSSVEAPAAPMTGQSIAAVSETLRRALLVAFPDRVARRRPDDRDRAVMVGGRGLRMGPSSRVRGAPLFLCIEVQRTRELEIANRELESLPTRSPMT